MAAPSGAAMLLQLYHHIVLPRQVPGSENKNLHVVESELLDRLVAAVKVVAQSVPSDHQPHVEAARLALSTCKSVHVEGQIDRHRLEPELRQLRQHHSLILHVTEQNAALIAYRGASDSREASVVFEAFEASAACEKVLASEGALQWDFPGQAVSLPDTVYSDDNFRESLAGFLDQASSESIKQFSAVTQKACAPLPEIRDTPEPTLVTGVLMTILETLGESYASPLLRKRVRDTVSFDKARKPWRRSALYLVVRVAIQRHLYRLLGPDIGRLYYKVIICVFLTNFLNDSFLILPHEVCHFLRQKLGRRLSKLEVDRERSSVSIQDACANLWKELMPTFEKTLSGVAQYLESDWEAYKRRTRRIIQPLPDHANVQDMAMRLPCSGFPLNRALHWKGSDIPNHFRSPAELLGHYETTSSGRPMIAVMNRYNKLSKFDEDKTQPLRLGIDLSQEPESRCIRLSRHILTSISMIRDSYSDYPELLSRHLLSLMELWAAMDRAAMECYPHLSDYHPGFHPDTLDALQLLGQDEMMRLHAVQSYIAARCHGKTYNNLATIFANPSPQSFAARYYDEAADSDKLKALRQEIEDEAEEARTAKYTEWEEMSELYEDLVRQMVPLRCHGDFERVARGKPRHTRPCRWHELNWKKQRLQIEAFEYPLPEYEPEIKAIIFELACPKAFAAYRDATWSILSTFAYSSGERLEQVLLLQDYRGLQVYDNDIRRMVTLGSLTKSHLDSHYRAWKPPVTFEQICKRFAMSLKYYDGRSETWTAKKDKPSFAHLFPLKLPRSSPLQSLQQIRDAWPSSNNILANQTRCPPDTNVHEFTAWQGLLVGSYARWPSLLRELGSTNVNFSTDSTWAFVSRLTLEVGPSSANNALRDVHSIFQDNTFCSKLLDQIKQRLTAIQNNWREPVQMDMLISMMLKTLSLGSSGRTHREAVTLLRSALEITHSWCTRLRTVCSEPGREPSKFAVWAPVLCKRIFYALTQEHGQAVDATIFRSFISASIELQNNLVGKLETLPLNLRNAVVQDYDASYRARHLVQDAVVRNPCAFLEALNEIWPVPPDYLRSPPGVFTDSTTWWIFLSLAIKADGATRHVHFNILSGALLIDGQQLGMLPQEFRRSPIIQSLFGNQSFHAFPSMLAGMSLVINRTIAPGYWIHLGLRDNGIVVRAMYNGVVFEFIPPEVFGQSHVNDLPTPLIVNCYHWLNLNTGILEIRQGDPWKSKRSNWQLDLRTRRATRNNGSQLVDPHSALAARVARNFYQFEFAHQITVFQPANSRLRVELKRLELDFFVNRAGLLQSPQLGAVIAESHFQDAGTWYGLRSKIVVRSVPFIKNRIQRSILVPIGDAEWAKDGQHVAIVIRNAGAYLRFSLDEVLGRVECPGPEPRLLYTRALWHAFTSHFLPDRLTGRTGVEESLRFLQTGLYQPWTPIQPEVLDLLKSIAALTPARAYYPTNLKYLETVRWDPALSTLVQDDRFRSVVERIFQQNNVLCLFTASSEFMSGVTSARETHLELRALSRIYAHWIKDDTVYQSRDHRLDTHEHERVALTSDLVSKWPSKLENREDLASILQRFKVIGGFDRTYDAVLFTNLLNIDFGNEWGALTNAAIECSQEEKYRLLFMLATVAFSAKTNMNLIRVLVSFATYPDLKVLSPPSAHVFSRFQSWEVPKSERLAELMQAAKILPIDDRLRGRDQETLVLGRSKHERESSKECTALAETIRAQWPKKKIDHTLLACVNEVYLDRAEALDLVRPEWVRLVDNYELSQYLEDVQLVLLRHNSEEPELPKIRGPRVQLDASRARLYPLRMRGGELPSLRDLLSRNLQDCKAFNAASPARKEVSSTLTTRPNGLATLSYQPTNQLPNPTIKSRVSIPDSVQELRTIVSTYKQSSSAVQKRYGVELDSCIDALCDHITRAKPEPDPFDPTRLSNQVFGARQSFQDSMNRIRLALQEGDCRARWLQHAGLWPKITPVTLLTELGSSSDVSLGHDMKKALVNLGLSITTYQRFLRIEDASRKNKQQQLTDELENPGHENWSPMEYADWLLLEVDSNIMLRSEQVDVALATITPASGTNSVLQLLMGKGKTSCILPMVALVLANKKQVCRLIVPRPLLLQSAQVMQSRIGGLLNREVLHVPFSRKTLTVQSLMHTYCGLHMHARKQKGVILALPEHILSFKLSGLQRLCDGRVEEATVMIKAQGWLDRHARDVMDECDVSLAIKTQLIYPSGTQMAVDGHPLRWQTIEAVLHLVRLYVSDIRGQFPNSVEIVKRPLGGYPLMYFLRRDAEDKLISEMVDAICTGQTTILPCSELAASCQEDLRAFISDPNLTADVLHKVTTMFTEKRHLLNVVRHLRGLFVHRILLSTMKKRWNVQYGLHPERDPIAVPYSALRVPSATAEWGHPDVAIILTTLSFYYEGLNPAQFKQAFEQLLKADEPSIEYEKWVTTELPENLREYSSINVEDLTQLCALHRYIRFNVHLLDFYLNNFVFPKHAKQFDTKLQASGWDLVQYDPSSQTNARTTGFSGTNDSRHQLPMMIKQNDLLALAHTNAEVLSYLLEERNRQYVRMVDKFGARLSEQDFLVGLKRNGIRVLIDAGAQIMEHDNKNLARVWLKIDHEASAAVYFDSDHRARVVYGKGTDVPLVASPYADNLANCLVYLDESHCRGTDLKLPARACAALTLGPHLTKDALVQAAMRLRLLGSTQSVVFFAPPEVHQSVLDSRKAIAIYRPTSADVIHWLLEQTCNGIEQLEPLHSNQGTNYLNRLQAKLDNPDFLHNDAHRKDYCSVVQFKDSRTLKELYEPKHRQTSLKISRFAPALQEFAKGLHQRRKEFQDHGIAVHSSALEEVEQEREVEIQVETVREVQPPVHFTALRIPGLHKDIKEFATAGQLPPGSYAYQPMFFAMQQTALGSKHGKINAATNIKAAHFFVSTEFTRTVEVRKPNDNFLRPCHWVLWSRTVNVGLLVNPEEANSLIPHLRKQEGSPPVHLIVYSAPITRRMLHFNSLDYYAIPPLPADFTIPNWFKVELGIFSGRLYFDWDEYETLLGYLGIHTADAAAADGEVKKRDAFAKKPLTFLHDWLAVRRKGQDFEHTPMGFVTTGKPLSSDHPFFLTSSASKQDPELEAQLRDATIVAHQAENEESDDDDEHEHEHLFRGDDMDDTEDDYEDDVDEDDNTFFEGGAYVEKDEDKDVDME